MTSRVARSVSSSRMRTSVGPETEATTLTEPKEKDALASALASVPNSAERGRSAVGEVLLDAEDDDAILAISYDSLPESDEVRLNGGGESKVNMKTCRNVNILAKVEILDPNSEFRILLCVCRRDLPKWRKKKKKRVFVLPLLLYPTRHRH